MAKKGEPKILIFDIETAPIIASVWGLWDQNIALNQIASDWHVMSWAAKWLDQRRVMYMDQRGSKKVCDDKSILKGLWKLLDEADVVVTQNGKAFDSKKVNARFIINGMKPPSPYKHIDTKILAKKHFAFTSNKLEYMADKLNKKYRKSSHKKFSGFELWSECLKGNVSAWKEMEKYNKLDVLATEELYKTLAPWGGTGVDLNTYRPDATFRCQCSSTNLQRRGKLVNRLGVFQKYQCQDCGAWCSESGAANNLLSKEKIKSLRGK